MKRWSFFLMGLLASPAFAEVAPVLYGDDFESEYYDFGDLAEDEPATQTVVAPMTVLPQPSANASRNISSRETSSRSVATSAGSTSGRSSAGADGRVVSARNNANTSSRTQNTASRSVAERSAATSRTTVSPRSTSARTVTTNASRTASGTRAATASAATRASGARATSARTATTSGAGRASRSAIMSIGSVNTTVDPLYNPNSRISVRNNSSTIGSRVPTIRVATANSLSTNDLSSTTASTLQEMDTLAEMTDYCKSQYAACMDSYCNVLDDNQGRCSCSANLKNYAKAESALKSATEELQEVAQKIQYIGLTTREVETLFNETEAELAMSNKNDTSQIKTSLDKIKNMLIEVRTGTASSDVSGSSFGFDLNGLLDFTIDSTGFDLSSFLGGFGTSTNSVNNQRGEELYKTASNRCKSAVLKSCTAQGVDANLITNSYDLQIDKECILYERSLTDSNDQMVATIRNAQSVLQKARLLVSQQKNVYDMRGCINALDSCMQDEFVCGTDYENCLDPTGRYIVNGNIVLGSQPGHAIDPQNNNSASSVMTSDVCSVNLYRTWDIPGQTCSGGAGNAWNVNDTLANYIEQTVKSGAAKKTSTNLSEYLQNKIGYADKDGKNYGMCMSVLNKCQDYTYNKSGYDQENDVIKQYLERVLIQIKAKQDQILSDYADSCVSDVTTCLSQNNYPSTASAAQSSVAANIAINACRPTIITCMSVNGYSIGTPTPTELAQWVCGIEFPSSTECGNIVAPSGGGTPYNISWTVDGGSVSGCAGSYTAGQSVTLSCSPTVPTNATFNGWCTDSSLEQCTSGNSVTINSPETGSKTYYAKWTCDSGYSQSGNSCTATPTCSTTNLSACNSETCGDLSGYTWCATTENGQKSCNLTSDCYTSETPATQPNYVPVTFNY